MRINYSRFKLSYLTKIVKRILKFLVILFGILLISIVLILFVDRQRTNFLKVENHQFNKIDSFLITNVNIIPMNRDTILVDKMVLVENGLISNIGENIEVKGVNIIDAKDKYLTPGLIDMHVHVWDKYELGLYLSNGITAV